MIKQNEWTAEPDDELKIPEEYITGLRYEINVFTFKKVFTFRCRSYEFHPDNEWLFVGVIIDTSKKDAKGKVTLKRVTYHPKISLVNVPFMVIPATEEETE